jgi:hypothetical protein
MDKHSSLSSSDKEKRKGTATLLIPYESPNHKMQMKKGENKTAFVFETTSQTKDRKLGLRAVP